MDKKPENKPIFELTSREEFYAVIYKDKNYMLQHTWQSNPDYYDNTIYDEEGKTVTDNAVIEAILGCFSDL